MNMLRPHDADLTLQERGELEMAYDGPIPPQAIADKIAQRPLGPPTHAEIVFRIKQCALDIEFYKLCLKEPGTDRMRAYDEAKIARLNAEIDRLDGMLVSMKQAAE